MTQPPAEVISAARASQKRWGIPASISLAQWAVESAWGKRTAGAFNFFGMKALPGQPCEMVTTHEVYRGNRVQVQAAFRKFSTCSEAFDAHAKLLATAGVYAHARAALPDVYWFAHALTGVYATDPHYGDTLESVIRGNRFAQYDAVPA